MFGLRKMKTLIPARPEKQLSGGRRLRHELKYIIDEGTYRVLVARLKPIMYADRNTVNGEYRVTSLYFDDIYNSGYNDKISGMAARRKFRIRSYNLNNSRIMLEAKHKDDNYVSKLSGQLTDEQYRALLRGDCSFMAQHDCEEDVFGEYYRSNLVTALRPKLIVDYVREALVYPHGNVRITFDKKLSTCYNTIDMFAEDAFYSPIYSKEIILEIKYDSYLPASIQAVLQGLNSTRQSVSKYIICSDKLMEVKTHGF
ncbi:MAG: polyphosphate polymerase domain-containing protein [Oscillospiraceae bacterium]|nr:polyphosphate polymerase domain-containing protein [Oscillospiraceae bacterium]